MLVRLAKLLVDWTMELVMPMPVAHHSTLPGGKDDGTGEG